MVMRNSPVMVGSTNSMMTVPVCAGWRCGAGLAGRLRRADVAQRIFFRRVHGHAKFARHGWVDEFDDDVAADAFDVTVAPLLKGEGGRRAATLLGGPLVGTAGGVVFDFVGRAVSDVDAAAVGFPAGDARRKMLVGVGDAAIMLQIGRASCRERW